MDQSMKLVEKHCSKYMEMFAQCIQMYPDTWQIDCEAERTKLAKCADTNPEIEHIKGKCGQQFYLYEKCMMENPSKQEKCDDLFTNFTVCAEEALDSFNAMEVSGKGSKPGISTLAGGDGEKTS